MSLATRCTHCGTIFKVVQDQLKVSEGWVRCGRCHEVFNALPALFDLDKDPPPPRVASPAPPTSSSYVAVSQDGPRADEAAAAPDSPPPDSQPPSGWEATQPTGLIEPDHGALHGEPQAFHQPAFTPPAFQQPVYPQPDMAPPDSPAPDYYPQQPIEPEPAQRPSFRADTLALDPTPIESATDFELDTSIAVDDNTPLEDVLASMAPRPRTAPPQPSANLNLPTAPAPQPWVSEPPQDVPSTDEEDALDSRYLMPSARERKAVRRAGTGPEFADAQFPSDAMEDAEEDWASDFGPSALGPDTFAPNPLDTASQDEPVDDAMQPASLALLAARPADDAPVAGHDEPPTTQPSRFGEDFTPEQPIEPPSLRKGRPGTRGRDPAQQTPQFVKRAQRKAFWRHPATRTFLSLILIGLMLTLGLQLVHQFRDLLAAYYPEARPALTQWCELAGCKLAPPLRLEDLQVESATLVRATSEGPDSYRLAVVVHNRASVDLAWPHIDLTLTDENGAVIARRVFSPTDAQWLDTADPKADQPIDARTGTPRPINSAASSPTAAPSGRSTTLQWRLLAPDLHPANYTAELFYP
jgi:predicted Zn finger-like uncharacterized protein